MKISRTRILPCFLLIAALLMQCSAAAFAAGPALEVYHLVGGTPDENGVRTPAYWVDSDGNRVEDRPEPVVRAAEATPTRYDLREQNCITPVKNQAGAGSCWAFGAIASLESSYILQGYGTKDNTDFSEAHLVWFSQHERVPNINDPTYGDGLECVKPFLDGGDWSRAAATLMRGSGLQLETANERSRWIETHVVSELDRMAQNESDRYVSHARLWSVTHISDELAPAAKRDALKQKILQNGVCALAYYDADDGYSAGKRSYYQKRISGETNHVVAVIGWDDNYSRANFRSGNQPPKNGAWLVKGSWGTAHGDNGFYWISYEDTSLSDYVSYVAAPKEIYDNIYQYDGAFTKTAVPSPQSGKMANLFRADRNELLTHAAIYSPNTTPVKATVEVYVAPENYFYNGWLDPTTNMEKYKAATTTVSGVEFGYTTVELAAPVPLRAGRSFTVVVTLELTDTTQTSMVKIPVEGKTVKNPANGEYTYSGSTGESFVNVYGIWLDSNNYSSQDLNNVPLKAMTRTVTLTDPKLAIESMPNKTTYRVGETFDPAGLSLLYTSEFGLSEVVTDGIVCSPMSLTRIGTQTVTATCNGLSVSFDVTVEPYERKLTVVTPPQKTTYMVGDAPDLTGLELLYTDEYNHPFSVTSGFTCETTTLSSIGTQSVNVTYNGLTVSISMTAAAYDATLSLVSAPSRTVYKVGETLDTTGLTLRFTDEYNREHVVTEGVVCTPQTLRTIGVQTVTATFGAKSVTFDVTVEAYEPTLTISSLPSKTAYLYGETLNTTGLTLQFTDEYGDALAVTEGFICDVDTLNALGTQSVSVTYNNLSVTFNVTVDPHEKTLQLLSAPTQTIYRVWDAPDLAGLSLLYTDEYNEPHTVADGFTVEPETLTEIGTQTVSVTYNGLSVTFDVTVEPFETTLSIVAPPDKMTYKYGDTLDTTGLELLFTDEYNEPHTVTEGYVCSVQTLHTIGTQTVTVTYGARSVAFDVTVEPLDPTLTLQSAPQKTTYLYGEALDTTGLVLLYTDEIGDALVVTKDFICDVETLSAFGTQTVTVSYNNLSVTFDVTVEPYKRTLTLGTLPTKTTYLYGEELDTNGLSLLFRNEYGEEHTLTEGYACEIVSEESFGAQTVVVTYEELSVQFEITVERHVPTLTLQSAPQTTTYFSSQTLDTTGLELLYTDEYGARQIVTEGFSCTPETLRALGVQTVTVTYNELAVTFDVTVEPLEPTLTLQSAPNKTAYLIGESPDTTGLELLYTDELGDAFVVTEGFTCEPELFRTVGEQRVTISYNGLSVTFAVTVELREPTLTVLQQPDTTRYFQGDTLDITGLTLVYSDEYGNVSVLQEGFEYESVTLYDLGYQTITVTFNGLTATFRVKVVLMDPTLAIRTKPNLTTYRYGDTLDTMGLSLLYTNEYNEPTVVTEGYVCDVETLRTLGTQTVTVTYEGLRATFDVTVEPLEPTLTLQTPPQKATYLYGDTLDTTGLELVYTDEIGESLVVTEGFTAAPTTLSALGTQTVTVTYNGLSVTFDVTVDPYEPTLTLLSAPDKTTCRVWDAPDLAGLSLLYTDEYNEPHTVTEGFSFEPETLTELGAQTVTVTYNDLTVTFVVTVEPFETTLTLVAAPDKTTYKYGDTLETAGLELLYTDEYNAPHTVTEGFLCSPQTLRTIGTQTVTVTYNAKSVTFDVTVEPLDPTLTLQSPPQKTVYLYGEPLDPTGLVLVYTDEIGDALAVTEGFVCDTQILSTLGTQTVTVTYNDLSVTFDVTVDPHAPTLTLLTPPDKTTYRVWDAPDLAGLSLVYTDEYNEPHTVTEGFSFAPETLSEIGAQTVTVTYNDLTVTFSVTAEPFETTLSLVAAPDKTTYKYGDTLDTAGLELLYTDEYNAPHTVTEGFLCSPQTLRTVGTQTVTVTYGAKTVTFDVTVELHEPTLTLLTTPIKINYLYGDTLDTTGLSVLYTDEYNEAHSVVEGIVCDVATLSVFGTQTVTVTYEDLTVTFDVTVDPHEPTLTLGTLPEKLTYLFGEAFDPTGLELLYADEYGVQHTVAEGYTYEQETLSVLGTQSVRVRYNELSVTFDVTVEPHEPTLTLVTAPEKTTYLALQTLDTTGLALLYTDKYGAAFTVTEGYSCTPETLRALGKQTVTVTYNELSVTFDVTVEPLDPTLTLQVEPEKKVYSIGDTLDTTGLLLVYTDQIGDAKMVTENFTCTPTTLTEVGTQTVTVTYAGLSVTFDVTVKLYDTSLTLAAAPTKTAYLLGDTLDTTGLALLYSDEYGVRHTVTDGFTCSPETLRLSGTVTVSVSYKGLSVSFDVTVEPHKTSLSIVSQPTKREYFSGQTLDTAGLKLRYSDAFGDVFDNVTEGFTCTPQKLTGNGTQTVTVTYKDASATFTVTVKPVAAVSLTVVSGPSDRSYTYKSSPNFSGLVVRVKYNDGHEETVSDMGRMRIDATDGSRVRNGSKSYRVTVDGVSDTFSMQVQLAGWQWLILILLFGFLWY